MDDRITEQKRSSKRHHYPSMWKCIQRFDYVRMFHETEHQKTHPLAGGVVLITPTPCLFMVPFILAMAWNNNMLERRPVLTVDRHLGLGASLGGREYTIFQQASFAGQARCHWLLYLSALVIGMESRGICCTVTEHHLLPNSLHLLNTLISLILEWLLLAAWCFALQADQHHRY